MEHNKKERSSFSGGIGFVLAAAGSAVGLGNLWRFPYLAAQYGGGIFILVYILSLIHILIDSTDEKGYMTDPTDEIFFGPDYLDIHGTGESDYWNVYVEPGKQREMKIGCLVPAETLEKAEIYWVCLNTKESSRKMTLENGDENK